MIHIGVLSPVTGGFSFGDVLAGIVREVAAAGGRVTVVQTLDAGTSVHDVLPAPDVTVPVGWESFDGFVAIAQACSAPYLRCLRSAGKPVVLVGNDVDVDAATVVTDNDAGIARAVAHLVGHGHSRIAFVGNLSRPDARERYEAYLGAMTAHGLPTPRELFIRTADHIESGGRAVAATLAAVQSPVTALVASTDRIALGLIEGLDALGVRVPHEVAVVGFDDVEAGRHSVPSLATVNPEVEGLGRSAAALVIAELRGEAVEHRRHLAPSTFLPRGSCGCQGGSLQHSIEGAEAAEVVVAAVHERLRQIMDGSPRPADLSFELAAAAAIDEVIERTLSVVFPRRPAREAVESFIQTVVRLSGELRVAEPRGLHAAERRERPPGSELVETCAARTLVLLGRLLTTAETHRSQSPSVSLTEQYEVGMGVLGHVDNQPADLQWLSQVSTRLACLALWDGPPESGRLRMAGVYDPDGTLQDPLPGACRVQEFPPQALVEQVTAAQDEALFVIPVRGASGDHGLLCLLGTVDADATSGRASYNHWAALLGVALQQRGLLEDVRRSDERYALVSAATEDGLWDWSVEEGTCFFSERCGVILGLDPGGPAADVAESLDPVELRTWLSAVHPDDVGALRHGLQAAVRHGESFEVEHRVETPEGRHRWVLCRGLPVRAPDGTGRRVIGSLSDIDTRRQLEDQLRRGALYDSLTGLPNRRLFVERLGEAVEASRGERGTRFSVVFLDLDGFKVVNDSLGHHMGDELLTAVARRLEDELRSVDVAARLGGDEFAILLTALKPDVVRRIVERVQDRIAEPVLLGGHEVFVTASVGIAGSETGYDDGEDALRDADIAMYHAKETEHGTASVFEPQMRARVTDRLLAQSELRTALIEDQFVVHYQPVVALDGSLLTSFEALVRWQHPQRGLLLPGEFLDAMVESGTIVQLGQWVIDAVCAQIASWTRQGRGHVEVSVNVSHREFWSDQLLGTITRALTRYGVASRALVLEITESVIMSDPVAARQIMADLQAAGLRLHIDDFGTGHSSLHALRAFPVDAFKIDQSFVQQLGLDSQTTELVRIIVAMGRALGIDVVAEGVETQEQAEELRAMGCGRVQGWLYAHAVPGTEAALMLGTRMDEALLSLELLDG